MNDKAKVFLGKAYLKCEGDDLHYGLYRDVIIEEKDKKTGKLNREKEGVLGPLQIFTEVEDVKNLDMQTFHPVEKRPLSLRLIWDSRDEKNKIKKDI